MKRQIVAVGLIGFIILNTSFLFLNSDSNLTQYTLSSPEIQKINNSEPRSADTTHYLYTAEIGMLSIFFPNNIFSSGELAVYCSSNNSITLHFYIQVISIKDQYSYGTFDFDVPFSPNLPYTVRSLQPNLLTPTGLYYLDLFIFNEASEENKLISEIQISFSLFFGKAVSYLVFGIFFLISLFVIVQKEVLVTLPFLKKQNSSIIEKIGLIATKFQRNSKENLEKIAYPQISCPDCKKKIIEGSAFCPECGYHLRQFERFYL